MAGIFCDAPPNVQAAKPVQELAPALSIVFGALAGSAALCCFAPAGLQTQGNGTQPGGRLAAIMIALASQAF
jgi:hypothetical protein